MCLSVLKKLVSGKREAGSVPFMLKNLLKGRERLCRLPLSLKNHVTESRVALSAPDFIEKVHSGQ